MRLLPLFSMALAAILLVLFAESVSSCGDERPASPVGVACNSDSLTAPNMGPGLFVTGPLVTGMQLDMDGDGHPAGRVILDPEAPFSEGPRYPCGVDLNEDGKPEFFIGVRVGDSYPVRRSRDGEFELFLHMDLEGNWAPQASR